MRRMTFVKMLLALMVCIAAVAFVRGWFVLSSQHAANDDNKIDIKLTVDPNKAKDDADKTAAEFTETVTEGAKKIGERATP